MMDDQGWPDKYVVPLPPKQPLNLVTGTPTTGLWCDVCLLPSRYTVPLLYLGDDGPICVGTFDHCDGHQ